MKTLFKLLCICVLTLSGVEAQQQVKKSSQTFDVNKDVVIDLNTHYTAVEIDTWNKNTVSVEAYVESESQSENELQEALSAWDLSVTANANTINIQSGGVTHSWANDMECITEESAKALRTLELQLADLPVSPLIDDFIETLNLDEIPKLPNLPEPPDGMYNFNFDYSRYKKEGELYLKQWSKEYEKRYGKQYAEDMKAWARQLNDEDIKTFERKMEAWGEQFGEEFGEKVGQRMEVWGEALGKQMEEWGEAFGKRMEAWGEALGERIEAEFNAADAKAHRKDAKKHYKEALKHHEAAKREHDEAIYNCDTNPYHKVKKVIKIKMPKKAKLNLNVKYGTLSFASVIYNAHGDIAHSSLQANTIDGGQTSINVSYSPVYIKTWENGALHLNFVDTANIQTVNDIMLDANSSNIAMQRIQASALINGSFGDLVIGEIAPQFNSLNVILDNSDARIALPKTNYKLVFKGNRSKLNNQTTTAKVITHTPDATQAIKTIMVNAKYSAVNLR